MTKITTDEQFIEHLAKNLGIGVPLTNWYWFGGETPISENDPFGLTDSSLTQYIDKVIGYKGDSDNPQEYFQHLYDTGKLSWEAIYYITKGTIIPYDRTFMVIFGVGYHDVIDKAVIECHGLPFFSESSGFTEKEIRELDNLDIGECLDVSTSLAKLTVVRVS